MRSYLPLALLFFSSPASAEEEWFELGGYFRLRGEMLYNLDLDRGTDASGEALYPVPLADPSAQSLAVADMRFRTDVALFALERALSAHLRLDIADNLVLGATPGGYPQETTTQLSPGDVVKLKHAYGEAFTPIGMLRAGRMGNHWGLGMFINSGECDDCNAGDTVDRLLFSTPLIGHLFSLAFDFSSSGVSSRRALESRQLDLEPSDDVRTLVFSILRSKSDASRLRRFRAGKTTFEYGGYFSYRWQSTDVPASYLAPREVAATPNQVVARNYRSGVFDLWSRLSIPPFRFEAEAAFILASIEQASLIPGLLSNQPIESRQLGIAFEADWTSDAVVVGVDAGYASGDPASGFTGSQLDFPADTRIDNFRFHEEYRIDRILFHEIIGRVTDAYYVRPRLRWNMVEIGARGALFFTLTAVASFAVQPSSTPGGTSPLGIEVDPTLAYWSPDGFRASLEYAVLFPFAAFDNVEQGLRARPAHLGQLRLGYFF
jgi:uncharacterized protein (TIGR04551 family)